MNTMTRMNLLAFVTGAALITAGCGDRNPPNTTSSTMTPPVAATPAVKAAVAVDDAAITTKVKAAVLAEPGLKTLDINVDTRDGVVTLAGTVGSPDLKQRATSIAQGVEGVRSVSDQLVVKSS